jgi:uncharacterized membrane protein
MSTRKIKNNNNDNSNTVDSKKTVKQVKVTGVRHEYKGIIPPPSIIDGYEKNCPGATDRILAMTENQLKSTQILDKLDQENKNECRKLILKQDGEFIKRGQIMGFVILLTMVFGGIVLVLFDKSIGGYSILIGSIVVELFYVIWNNSNKEKKSINN